MHFGVSRVLPPEDMGNHVGKEKEVLLPIRTVNGSGQTGELSAVHSIYREVSKISFACFFSTSPLKRTRITTKKLITCYEQWYLLRHAVSKWEFGLVFTLHLTLPLPSTDVCTGVVPTMTTHRKHMA